MTDRSVRDVGFDYVIDAATARRQFKLSVFVVVGLALATVVAALDMSRLSVEATSFYTVSEARS